MSLGERSMSMLDYKERPTMWALIYIVLLAAVAGVAIGASALYWRWIT